jgi:hypothetical protein
MSKVLEHEVAGPGGLKKKFKAVPIATLSELQEMSANGIDLTNPEVIKKQVDDALAKAGVSQVDAARLAAKEEAARETTETDATPAAAPETESPDPV